jgi:hypothetical protein
MVKVSGTLAIRTIHGSRGSFNVGRLITEIGEFAVKDSLIEEYDEGRYEGEFGIAQISPSNYFSNGRLVVEVRARLTSIALASINALNDADHSAIAEQDPVDEAPAVASVDPIPPGPDDIATLDTAEVDADQAREELFGTLWPLTDRVKLDPTVDRARFRLQRDVLKTMGYQFQPVGQIWVK